MATIRSITPLAHLIEAHNNAEETYRKSLLTDVSQYSMQERQVLKETRAAMRNEIERLARKIALADPSINATGVNKVDFINFRYNDAR